jgi:TatD DNase family protein
MTVMVDFHCHLDLYSDPVKAVANCKSSRAYILSVTTTPKAWRGTLALAKMVPRIRTSLGFHPQIAHERIKELSLFEVLLPETRYVGEVGLDGAPEYRQHWKEQLRVFERVLELSANAGGRILTIHSRRAAKDVIDVLEQHPKAGVAVLHWFTGSKAELQRAVAAGCWFSVGPPMMKSQRGREIIAAIPRNRMLTETDGPFCLDERRPLNPAEVSKAIDGLAATWRCTSLEAQGIVLANFKRLVSSSVGGGPRNLQIESTQNA